MGESKLLETTNSKMEEAKRDLPRPKKGPGKEGRDHLKKNLKELIRERVEEA